MFYYLYKKQIFGNVLGTGTGRDIDIYERNSGRPVEQGRLATLVQRDHIWHNYRIADVELDLDIIFSIGAPH